MGLKFNPLTAQFDLTGSGGGASYIDGEVATYNDLPLDGTAPLNTAWLVREASGIWPVSRKQAGIYIRTATAGSSRDADYTYAGTMPDVFSDAVFTLYDEASTTRTGQFNLGSVTAGQNRVLTWPDGNGTIARTSDIPSTFAASAITSGVFDNARINFAAPDSIGSTTRNSGAFTTLSANNGTLTASAPVLDLAQTWNNAAVTFTGLQFVVTNTASNAASLVSRFAVGASNVVETNVRGMTTFRRLGSSDLSNIVEFRLGSTLLANIRDDGGIGFGNNCTGAGCTMHDQQVRVGSGGAFVFTNASNNAFGTSDVFLRRDAADTLAQRNGTTAQTFRLYNTFTDASNHERLSLRWTSNVAIIGTEKAGTGSARALEFQVDGTTRFALASTGRITINPNDASSGDGVTITSSRSGGNARALVITDGGITCTGGQNRFLFGADVANTSNVLNNFNNALCLLLRRTSTGTGNFIDLQDSSNVSKLLIDKDANFVLPTSGGVKIGTATNQLLGFYGATPVDRPATVADPTGGGTIDAEARTAINDIIDRLQELGLIA